MILREDQVSVLTETRAAFRKSRAVILRAPTGFGKTVVASEICRSALNLGRSVIFSTPRIELIKQASGTFGDMPVWIACKQTLVRRDMPPGLLIDDESHYGLSDAWAERLNAHTAAGGWVLGLTASPVAGMDRVYQDMVHGPPVRWLMDQSHLSDYRAFGPTTPDLSGVPIQGGEFAKKPLGEVMDRPSVTGDAVKAWLQFARGLRTVGYCVSRKHARNVVAQFCAAGIRAEYIAGDVLEDERRAIIERFANGETQWLGSVDLVTLGFDLSSQIGYDCPIECIQDLAPTNSLPRHIQKCGRALRKKLRPATLIDHAGNLTRLGFPDEDYEFSIASGTKRPSASIAVSICGTCFAAFSTSPACPYCGVERQLTPREVLQKEGELQELFRQEQNRDRIIKTAIAAKSENPVAELAKVAKAKGFKRGWVLAQLKVRKIKHDRNTVWAEISRIMR